MDITVDVDFKDSLKIKGEEGRGVYLDCIADEPLPGNVLGYIAFDSLSGNHHTGLASNDPSRPPVCCWIKDAAGLGEWVRVYFGGSATVNEHGFADCTAGYANPDGTVSDDPFVGKGAMEQFVGLMYGNDKLILLPGPRVS